MGDGSCLDRASVWRRRLERFATSRTTVARFCREAGVSVASFYYWRRVLGNAVGDNQGATSAAAGDFQTVAVVPSSGIVVQLPGGTRIEISANHAETIRAVLAEVLRADGGLTTQPAELGPRKQSNKFSKPSPVVKSGPARRGVKC